MDHVEYLGDTLEKIATEKAAILRRGVPAVIGRQTEGPLSVIAARAVEVAAPLHVAGQDWVATEERGRLVYQDADGLLDLPPPRLFGRHQFDNAGTAIAALRAGGLRLPAPAFEQGVVAADWPARMQWLSAGALVASAPVGSELWLDGGHNAEGGRIVAGALADLEERASRPLVLIVGMLSTKDAEGFLRNFAGLARALIAVPIGQEKGLAPDALAAIARRVGLTAQSAPGIEDALAMVCALELSPPPRVLITGSLYLAGEVLTANGTLPG
jgi:dihydrofolate synthase/folylpolyglutamate synthase